MANTNQVPVSQLRPLTLRGWTGLDYTLPNTAKAKENFGNCADVNIDNGVVISRTGHTLLKALAEVPVSIGCYQTFEGIWYLIAFGLTKVYKWNTGTLAWDDISGVATFTGDADDLFSACIFLNKYYFTNRIDNIHSWASTGNIADTSIAYKVKHIIPFGERLVLYNTVEGGVDCFQRVRWPIAGSASDYTGTGSGFQDLVSEMGADPIITAEALANTIIVYGEDHLLTQRYVGGRQVFAFDPCVINTGLISKEAIVAFPHTHLFVGRDNVYSYSGGTNIQAIGNPIVDHLFSTLNSEYRHKLFMEYHEDTHLLYIYYPSVGESACDSYVCRNMLNNTWTKGTAMGFVCGARYRTTSALTVGDMDWHIGTENLTWRVGDALSGVSFPYAAYGCEDKVIVKADPAATTDNGDAYTSSFETYDITLTDRPDTYIHFFELLLEFQASGEVGISWSKDEGDNWTALTALSAQAVMATKWKDLGVNEVKVRFKFSGTTSWSIRSLIFTFFPGTHML